MNEDDRVLLYTEPSNMAFAYHNRLFFRASCSQETLWLVAMRSATNAYGPRTDSGGITP